MVNSFFELVVIVLSIERGVTGRASKHVDESGWHLEFVAHFSYRTPTFVDKIKLADPGPCYYSQMEFLAVKQAHQQRSPFIVKDRCVEHHFVGRHACFGRREYQVWIS